MVGWGGLNRIALREGTREREIWMGGTQERDVREINERGTNEVMLPRNEGRRLGAEAMHS